MSAFLFNVPVAQARFSIMNKLSDDLGKRELCEQALSGFQEKNVQISRTRDGDTFDVQINGKSFGVRMLSVDTPESFYEGHSQGEWATEAKTYLKKVLKPKETVTLQFGRDKCDFYGRILAYVKKGPQDLNAELLRRGLAVNYCVYPEMDRCLKYGKIVHEAKEAGRGLWSDSTTAIPYEWRADVRGTDGAAFVGDIDSREVRSMRDLEDVDVEKRVFFLTRRNFFVGKKF